MCRCPSHGPLWRTHGARPARAASSLPVEGAQLGQVAQDAQGGDRAQRVQLFEGPDLRLQLRRAGQGLLAFLFHRGHLLFKVGHEFLLLAREPGRQAVLGGLTGARQLLFEVVTPLRQGTQFIAGRFAGRGVGAGRRAAP